MNSHASFLPSNWLFEKLEGFCSDKMCQTLRTYKATVFVWLMPSAINLFV